MLVLIAINPHAEWLASVDTGEGEGGYSRRGDGCSDFLATQSGEHPAADRKWWSQSFRNKEIGALCSC